MKKSSRIKNTIKYFGISSATLLAAAPVVAPTVSNVLGWYGANSAFTTKKSEKVSAATQLGTFDRSKYSEYDNLFQNGVKMGISGDSLAEIPSMQTIGGDVEPATAANAASVNGVGINYATLAGLRKLAQLTGGDGLVPGDLFSVNGLPITSEDIMHYLFTNTDGSERRSTVGLSNDLITAGRPLKLQSVVDTVDQLAGTTEGRQVNLAIRYLSSQLHGGTIAGILGDSVFGDPNKATVKVYIDGQNGASTPNLITLLQEGVITITLVAQSGDNYGKTAQANIVLKNSTVLLKGVDAKELAGSNFATSNEIGANPNQITAEEFTDQSKFPNGSLLSNVSALSKKLPMLTRGFNGTNITSEYIPKGAVPTIQVGTPNLSDSGNVPQYYKSQWQDNDPKAKDYFAGADAAKTLSRNPKPSIEEKTENVGAYTTGSIVVPKGTSYRAIVNDLSALKFTGTPTSDVYPNDIEVAGRGTVAFDDVKSRPGNIQSWDEFLSGTRVIDDNFFDKNGGINSPVDKKNLNDAVVGHSFSLDVPVYGDIKLGGVDGTRTHAQVGTNSNGPITLYESPRGQKVFIKDYGASKPRVTARVNVIVYDTKAPEYSLGTKPSFVFFNKSTNSNAIYSTVYDDGATLLQNELPQTLGNALKLSVNDSRFYANGEFSSQKFASYIAEKFGQSVENKEILISDEDKATSDKHVDLSNLPKDTDFPNANKYTIRSDKRGKNISVDASSVDLSKAGSGTLKITYTNSKNEHGIGTETATLTLPYQVGVAVNPVFYFMDGINQTITAGDKFNPMMFKVTQDQDSMDNLVSTGEIYDKAPYVNNPSKTGLDVTVGGNVDTTTPGNYTLTYVAKNVATGATTTLTRNITVLAKSDNKAGYDVNDFKTIGYVNYVPGYGIAVYDAPDGQFTSQRLPHGSAWRISHQAVSRKNSKDVWYQVGKNQWIKADYVSMTPVSNARYFNAVGRVNYVTGYSIKVWKDANKSQWTGKYLANGTSWKVFGEQDGFYNVGGNQWVEKQYIELSK